MRLVTELWHTASVTALAHTVEARLLVVGHANGEILFFDLEERTAGGGRRILGSDWLR